MSIRDDRNKLNFKYIAHERNRSILDAENLAYEEVERMREKKASYQKELLEQMEENEKLRQLQKLKEKQILEEEDKKVKKEIEMLQARNKAQQDKEK
jgi:hypothetical protein